MLVSKQLVDALLNTVELQGCVCKKCVVYVQLLALFSSNSPGHPDHHADSSSPVSSGRACCLVVVPAGRRSSIMLRAQRKVASIGVPW